MSGALNQIGRLLAGFWLSLLAIAVLLSFPICGLIASFAVGAGAFVLVGRGMLGTVALFSTAFGFGLFLSLFVWPHAKAAVLGCAEAISEKRP